MKTAKTSKKKRCFEVLAVFAVQKQLELMG
jgi:hypothetical protein